MDRFEAARALGVADADVLDLAESTHGVEVDVRDGGRRLIRDDGTYALDDHPNSAGLRRWSAEPEKAEPAPETPAEAGDDDVPDGTADDVLEWVGDDPSRAEQALAAEQEREHPRSTLAGKLRKVAER